MTQLPTITSLSTPDRAGPGDMAYATAAYLEAHPETIEAFGGALLIMPETVWQKEDPPFFLRRDDPRTGRLVRAPDPKLAFVRLAWRHLTSELADTMHDVWEPEAGPHLGHTRFERSRPGHIVIRGEVTVGARCAIGGWGFGYVWDEEAGCHLRFPHVGRVVIEDGVEIGSNVCIDRGALTDTVIRTGAKIDNFVHVAHGVEIGEHALVIAGAILCGSCRIGARAHIAPGAVIRNGVTVGEGATVGLAANVVRDVPPGAVVMGNPARER